MSRYIVALSLILFCVAGGHYLSISVVDSIRSSSDLISESINQSARVERVVSAAHMADALKTSTARQRLKAEIDEIEQFHNALLNAAAAEQAVHALYAFGGKGPALDPVMRKFIADARLLTVVEQDAQVAEAALGRLRWVSGGMLPTALQEANQGHQLAGRTFSSRLSMVQNWAFALAVIILIFEAVFIFLPAHRSVRAAVDSLSQQAADLTVARNEVEARNEALEALRSAAEHDALHDGLTGLSNRRGFERRIEALSAAARGANGGVALLHIDLDRFKEINDTLGHAAGDEVLRHVGRVLREEAGPTDVVARIGGDEFILARKSDGRRDALSDLAARIIDRLSRPVSLSGESCQFGASIGIGIGIVCEAGEELDASRLMANADIALYRAKELGRGRYEFFSEDLRDSLESQKSLSDDLILGLERSEFFPYYQPQVDPTSGRLVSVEALARWRHPERGVLGPATFLPIAARLKLTDQIDRAIQNQALKDLAHWDEIGVHVPKLSLNVSSDRLRDPELLELARSGATPRGRVAFELLETMFSDQLDEPARFAVDALQEAGIAIEIDDFGTGHASLLALVSLSPARLKIARELAQPALVSPQHRALVQSVCEIARSLEIGVTAEGVETEAQRVALAELGCDRMQGFFFARPMPADALVESLQEGRLISASGEPIPIAG
ncbi:MAG: EAL domain-containing protein [Pseudomonadota bacterium]